MGNESRESLDDYLHTVLIGGPEQRPIVIAEWTPAWAARYERERKAIQEALGGLSHRVEHVGSTSVPGLAAKPIVDVMVSVPDPDDEASFRPALERCGYELRVREQAHRMFRTTRRDVQIHIWAAGSHDERRHLLFRDWLRLYEPDRALYERTKRDLATREWPDTNHYAEAKTPVITEIMDRAEQWAAGGAWRNG